MSANYDVVIVGGGIAGLSLASALAGKCSVALVEAEQTLAYHTSARSARQLIPSYGPAVVQELTLRTLELIAAQDAGRPEPVLSPAQLHADRRRSHRPGGSQRPHAPDHPCRGDASCARSWCPESFSAAGLDTGSFACNAPLLLEDHRQRAEAGGVDIITGARVHSAQRLGSGWELGAGQEGFQAAVVVNAAGAWADELAVLSGVEKLGLQPYRRTAAIVDVERPLPEGCPMVAAADESFYFRRDGERGPDLALGVRAEPARGRPAVPGRRRGPDRPAQRHDHPRHPRCPQGLDRAADGSGRRRSGGGVRRRSPRILLARRPGRVRVPDLLGHRRTGRRTDPGRPGTRRSACGGTPAAGPASRTAEALAATRWSIRR